MDKSQYSLKNLYSKARELFGQTKQVASQGYSNLKGNVQALSDPQSRQELTRGLQYSGNKVLKTPLPQSMQGFAQNVGKLAYKLQPIARPASKFLEGYGEGATYGLVDVPTSKSANLGDRAAYTVGNITGLVTSPVNKLGAMAKLDKVGAGATRKILSKVAPTTKNILTQKIIPAIGAETAQSIGYGLAATGAGVAGLRPGYDFTAKNLAIDTALGLGFRGIGNAVPKGFAKGAQAKKMHPEDVAAVDAVIDALKSKKDVNKARITLDRLAEYYVPKATIDELRNKAKTLHAKDLAVAKYMQSMAGQISPDWNGYQLGIKGAADAPTSQVAKVGGEAPKTTGGIGDLNDVKKRLLSVYTLSDADKTVIRKAKTAEELAPYLRKLEGGSLARFFNSSDGRVKPIADPLGALKIEARKYKSAEEFADSLNAMKYGKVTGVGQLPISKINKTQIKALTERGLPHTDTKLKVSDFKPGRQVTQPLEVYSKGGSWVVENGNHRLAQALANGDKTIPVVFKGGEGKKYATPITDLYTQATAPKGVSQILPETKLTAQGIQQPTVKLSATPDAPYQTGSLQPKMLVSQPQTQKVLLTDQLQSQTPRVPDSKLLVKVQNQTSEDIIQQAKKEIGRLQDEPKRSVKKVADDLYTQWVNRYAPIERLADKAKSQLKIKGAELRPEADPTFALRRLTGAGGIADTRYQQEFKPIIDQMDNLKIPKDEMDIYLKARRDIGLSGRGIKGSDKLVAQQRMAILEQKHPEISRISKQLYEYQNKGFQEMIDSGFLSPESAQLIRQQNPDYVPFQRVMDQMDEYLGLPTRKTMQGTNPVLKIKGSDKQVYSPLESVIANTFKQRGAIEKNNVAKSIVNLQKVADLGIEKVSKSGPDTITVWNNGQKEFYRVGEDIAETAKGLNEENTNTLLKIFQAPAALLRQGATGRNPDFMIPNIVRDQMDAAITSKYGYIPMVDYFSGLRSMMKNDDIYKKWQSSGAMIDLGEMSGRKSIQASFDQAKAKKSLFSWLGDKLDTMGKYSEQPTRVGLFKKAYQKTGNINLAMMESRDATVDFARMGSKMKTANSIIPFLNVGIQGFDKLIRSARSNPAKVALNMTTYGVLPAASIVSYNLLNHPEEYAEVPQYEKDSNFVLIKGRNADGTVDYLTFPKGNILPLVANPTENLLSFMFGQDQQSFSEFATQFVSGALPVVGDGQSLKEVALKTIGSNLPQMVKPITENLLNKSFYKYSTDKEESKEIVPYYLKKKEPYQQAYDWTPTTYKAIGSVLNVSPLQVQNLMEGYLAGYAKVPSNIIDSLKKISEGELLDNNTIPVIRRFIKTTYPTSGTKKVEPEKEKTSFMDRITGKVSASSATALPQDKDSLEILYKDAESTIRNYKSNKVKSEAGLIKKDVADYQAEVDQAIKLKKQIESQYPGIALDKYTDGLTFKSTGSKYQDAINEKKIWEKLNSLNSSDSLTDDQKSQATALFIQKAGIDPNDYQYYQIAKQDTDLKTMYALEEITKIQARPGSKPEDLMNFLKQGRYEFRGNMVLSSGVIDNLVDEGILTYSEGKSLKKYTFDKDPKTKMLALRKKKTGGKVKKPKKISLKAIKVPKIKVIQSSGKRFDAPKIKAISVKLNPKK